MPWVARAHPIVLLLALWGCTREPQAPRAQGDPKALLGAVSIASSYAVVRIDRVARIDRSGYRAFAVVEQALTGALAPKVAIELAWEELASHRAPRFARGEQVLVALAPLPSTSLWLHRFPPQLRKKNIFLVAASGDAFLRNPEPSRLGVLSEYLSLPPSERAGVAGARALARLGAFGERRLAVAALEMLAEGSGHAELADPVVTDALVSALGSNDGQVREAVLSLAQRHQLLGLRARILDLATSPEEEPALSAWQVLVSWKDPTVPERAPEWARNPRAEWRALAARAAAMFDNAALTEQLLTDPAPAVRLAIAQSLPAEPRHLPKLLALMADRDDGVQRTAATKVARVGPAALPALENVLSSGDSRSAAAAILALADMGNDGRAALERVAAEHTDPSLRQLAAIALGRQQREH